MDKKFSAFILVIISLIFGGTIFAYYTIKDTVSPTMSFSVQDDQATYKSGDEESVLKKYVTATDNIDGDISNNVVIENFIYLSDYTRVKVTFVVRDSSNNITKKSLIFKYEASENELEELKTSQIAFQNSVNNDNVETNVSNDLNSEETNDGNKENISSNPELILKKDTVTLSLGQTFNIADYIESLSDDNDSFEELSKKIVIDGNYDIKKKGEYKLVIYCKDKEGNLSNKSYFTLNIN